MRYSLAILALTAMLAAGQTRKAHSPGREPAAASAERTSWPIQSIAVQGNHNYTTQQVENIAAVRVGQVVGKPELEAAHERLMSSGVFDSVAYRYVPAGKGVAVTFEVVEVNQFYPVMFEDLPAKDADLRAWLKQKDPLFGPKISATKESLEHFSRLISEYLAQRNFTEPVVGKLSSENPPDLVVLFRPSTARPTIAEIRAVNTGEIPTGVVQSTLYGVALGSVYSEPRVRQLLESSIRPLYDAKGHLQVKFPKIEAEPAKDVKGLAVRVSVEEGPVFNFGKFAVAAGPIASDELEGLLKLKGGTLADFDQVREAQGRIVDRYRHEGYMQAHTEVPRTLHEADKTVDLIFRVDPGPQFLFHELTIVGLDLVSEPVIRKLWGLKPGQPFNPAYPEHFVERVKEQGLFDNLKGISQERKVNPDTHTVDVIVTFQ